jgi:hypothetical protein
MMSSDPFRQSDSGLWVPVHVVPVPKEPPTKVKVEEERAAFICAMAEDALAKYRGGEIDWAALEQELLVCEDALQEAEWFEIAAQIAIIRHRHIGPLRDKKLAAEGQQARAKWKAQHRLDRIQRNAERKKAW